MTKRAIDAVLFALKRASEAKSVVTRRAHILGAERVLRAWRDAK